MRDSTLDPVLCPQLKSSSLSLLASLLWVLASCCFLLFLSGCVSVEPPVLKTPTQVQTAIKQVTESSSQLEEFAGAYWLRLASVFIFLFGALVSVVVSALRREFCLHSLAVGTVAGSIGLFIPVVLSLSVTLLSWTLVGAGLALVITVSYILYKRHVSINSRL